MSRPKHPQGQQVSSKLQVVKRFLKGVARPMQLFFCPKMAIRNQILCNGEPHAVAKAPTRLNGVFQTTSGEKLPTMCG